MIAAHSPPDKLRRETLFPAIPAGLRDPLLQEYRALCEAHLRGQWKVTALDAGRFCEVVYTILDGATANGIYATTPSKPPNFPRACTDLAQRAPVAVGDRSLRVLIPRVLLGIYDVRNNRNVGHVGGDVVANEMDAGLVRANATWVLAELVRIFHGMTTDEASEIVHVLTERRLPLVWEYNGLRRVLNTELQAADRVLLLLYEQPSPIAVKQLCKWAKYSNASVLRGNVLGPLDKALKIEFDVASDTAVITPLGMRDVEARLLS